MKKLRNFIVIATAIYIAGCGSAQSNKLGDLKYKPEKEKEIEFKKLNHDEVRKEYKELLDLFEDKSLKEQIERRIADVYMMEGNYDQIQEETAKPKSYYVDAIKEYRSILKKYPNSPDNAEVLYQLAKAYDIEGNTDEAMKMLTELVSRHPSYSNIAEAHFRRGDIQFNEGEYAAAERSYRTVTTMTNDRLKLNAHYMLAWSYYKQYSFRSAVDHFALVFNALLADIQSIDALSKTSKTIVDDTIHSMSLALDKLGGPQSIEDIDSIKNKPYIWMVYDEMGNYYLGKELYEDSANAYRSFVVRFKDNEKSPFLHKKMIDAYLKGSFPQQALEEKESYIASYGIYSEYAGNKSGVREDVKVNIKTYLDELSGHFHGAGQVYDDAAKKLLSGGKKEQKISGAARAKADKKDKLAKEAYIKATRFYQEYVDTFPKDKRVDEIVFLKAEANYSAQRYENAIKDYEFVAYTPVGVSAQDKAPNAGYAAIVSHEKHMETLSKDKDTKLIEQWQIKTVDSMLRFASKFDSDERSPAVLASASEYLFSLNQYERALAVSEKLIQDKPNLDASLKKTAYGIVAHSNFKLERFQAAEDAYINQRALVAPNEQEYKDISERLANTIYKKSEAMVVGGNKDDAIVQFLKIKTLVPTSPVRVIAQYDAASLLLGLERWPEAIVELEDIERNYPSHELIVELQRKLAFVYQKNNNWAKAANKFLYLSEKDPQPKIRQDSLFESAEMFEKTENYREAIKHYKAYDERYNDPFDTIIEARYKLAVSYEKVKNIEEQHVWLKKIIDADKRAGNKSNNRSQYLAAWSNAKFGDFYAKKHQNMYLRQPLADSIAEKNAVLEMASGYYQNAAEYNIFEFVTMSSFKLAGMYKNFATALRRAPRPSGLAGDDVALYLEIVEEQALPFDDLALELHEANIKRAWDGEYNEWVGKSFDSMRVLDAARYNKTEKLTSYGDGIH